ncbi:hypothetical protein WJX73_005383 [Symbiochloris irregularis]|uniref:Molybdopterin biosynthesis protein CNX1 n=1 Tax=Symbiochloris irregularis TaxID=706552 RepID=A0AAW1NLK0_9CHLO
MSSGPRTPEAAYKFVSIPEAQQTVLHEALVLPSTLVDLQSATGRVLAADVTAREPLPPFPSSIKDGYAVRSSDAAGDYEVAFEALAGLPPGVLEPGFVAYISTGGPVPSGADAVVQIENTEPLPLAPSGKRRVKIKQAARGPGQDVRAVGSDIQEGQVVLKKGTRLNAAEIGLLATVGASRVQVHVAPHVGILSTGDELVEPATESLASGKIRDANRSMLLAAAQQAGARVTDFGIAADTEEAVEAAFAVINAAHVDVLLTTGGVSMGDKDFIKPILERQGKVHFGKVRMKPGKPLTFATHSLQSGTSQAAPHRMLSFGLPGNPVSAIVTFNLTVLPALRKMAGWQDPDLRRVYVRTTTPLPLDSVRPEYHRATVHWQTTGTGDGHLVAESTGGQISSRLLSMLSANALLELPQAEGTLPAGSVVSALLIGDLQSMPVPQGTAKLTSFEGI